MAPGRGRGDQVGEHPVGSCRSPRPAPWPHLPPPPRPEPVGLVGRKMHQSGVLKPTATSWEEGMLRGGARALG